MHLHLECILRISAYPSRDTPHRFPFFVGFASSLCFLLFLVRTLAGRAHELPFKFLSHVSLSFTLVCTETFHCVMRGARYVRHVDVCTCCYMCVESVSGLFFSLSLSLLSLYGRIAGRWKAFLRGKIVVGARG